MHMTWTEVQPAAGTTVWSGKGYNGAGDVRICQNGEVLQSLTIFVYFATDVLSPWRPKLTCGHRSR
jgi:hypothetical protein